MFVEECVTADDLVVDGDVQRIHKPRHFGMRCNKCREDRRSRNAITRNNEKLGLPPELLAQKRVVDDINVQGRLPS